MTWPWCARQLGRPPRGVTAVAHRCPCGLPDVVQTAPRLPDGTPFPTLYYLTCPRAAAAVSRLEAAGVMRDMTERLRTRLASCAAATRPPTRTTWPAATPRPGAAGAWSRCRPARRRAGGMPDRVKCLHALVAHELAVPGANPLGREALAAAGPWWAAGPCVTDDRPEDAGPVIADGTDPIRNDDRRPGRVLARRVAAIDCGTNSSGC